MPLTWGMLEPVHSLAALSSREEPTDAGRHVVARSELG